MMQPKRTKFRKQFKGRIAGNAQRGNTRRVRRIRPQGHRPRPHDGARDRGGAPRHFALREARRPDLDPGVPGRADHAEAARSAHGSGKGNVEYWVAKVLPGKVLFEIEGMSEEIAREAFRLASAKLSVSTAFVKRQVRHEGERFARQGAGGAQRGAARSCVASNSTCAWRAPPARRRSRIRFAKVRKNIARVKTVLAAAKARGGKV